MNKDIIINFEILFEEAEKIINALALLPYKDSFLLISELQKQARQCLEQNNSDLIPEEKPEVI